VLPISQEAQLIDHDTPNQRIDRDGQIEAIASPRRFVNRREPERLPLENVA
jgi:hypothetical protein